MSLMLLITVVHPRLELPRSPPLLFGVSALQQAEGPAVARQDWEAGAGERRRQLGVEGGVTPAVPI